MPKLVSVDLTSVNAVYLRCKFRTHKDGESVTTITQAINHTTHCAKPLVNHE